MENDNTNISSIAFIKNVKHHWSVETVAEFLEKKLPHLNFHVDTPWYYDRKTALELLVGDKTRHTSRDKSIMCLLLKHGADPVRRRRDGGTTIRRILRNKDSTLIVEFLKYVEDINMIHGKNTALYVAVQRELKDVVEYIIGRNADINKTSDKKRTPLHESVSSKSVDITEFLLENEADTEVKDAEGKTPLHLAVEYNKIDQVRTLIKYGADVNSTNNLQDTPLHTLCSKGSFNFELYDLLLQKTDPNARNAHGATPLHYLMRFLPPANSTSKKKKLISLFLTYGGNLYQRYHLFDSVLHAAAFFNHSVSFLTFLIEKVPDTSVLDVRSQTFMHLIKWRSNQSEIEELLKFLFLRECKGKFKFNHNLLNFIESDKKIMNFADLCKNELRILKDTKLGDNDSLSLFTVLSGSENVLAKIYHNNPLRTEILSFDTEKFPIYGSNLVRNHQITTKRCKAEASLFVFLTKASNDVLDQDSIYEIVKFISTKDIIEIVDKKYSII